MKVIVLICMSLFNSIALATYQCELATVLFHKASHRYEYESHRYCENFYRAFDFKDGCKVVKFDRHWEAQFRKRIIFKSEKPRIVWDMYYDFLHGKKMLEFDGFSYQFSLKNCRLDGRSYP